MNQVHLCASNSGRVEDRREARLTTMLPVIEIEGVRRVLKDFSASGFRCEVPSAFRDVSAQGEAMIEIQAAGYVVTKHVRFTVRHVHDDSVGASFEVLSENSQSSGLLF